MSQHPSQSDYADTESFRRALDCTKKENQDLHNIIKKMQEEKSKLEDKNKEMEAQIKDLREISPQDQPGSDQYKPDYKVLNEGLEIMLKQSQQHITGLLRKNKKLHKSLQELQGIAEEKKIVEALADDMAVLFEKTEEKNEILQKKLDEALQINQKMIKEKQQQEAEHREMECKLEDINEKHEETQQKRRDVEESYSSELQQLEEKHEQTQHKLKEMEERYKGLQVTLDGALQRNAELQREKEQEVEEIRQAVKAQDEKYKDLKGKHSEKEKELEQLQKRCSKLQEENAQIFSEVHRLILQKKDLEDLKNKRRRFFYFFSRGSAASPAQPGEK